MQKRSRVFLDTSALLAGLNSPTGAAGAVIAACFSGDIVPIISPQVIEEAERNIGKKFPALVDAWRSFLLIPPQVTKQPTLASAITAKPDALVTWDVKHFLRPDVVASVDFRILTPGEFLTRG